MSACLLGEEVRYDGQHKLDRYVRDVLGAHAELVPFCPEEEAGFGTPREAMRLVGDADAPRLVTIRSKQDVTAPLARASSRRARELEQMELDGYILKAKSPSCGIERVKVYGEARGVTTTKGRGLFAAALIERMPGLPVEEEGRLHDPGLREGFIVRVFCRHRFRAIARAPWRLRDLVDFHARHKLVLMAHSETHMRALGRVVAGAKKKGAKETFKRYEADFFEGMARVATRRKHTNSLQHAMGHLRRRLDAWDRNELATLIERYRTGQVPLIVPITLLRHYVDKLEIPYLLDQVYLRPHPDELMLLNHV